MFHQVGKMNYREASHLRTQQRIEVRDGHLSAIVIGDNFITDYRYR